MVIGSGVTAVCLVWFGLSGSYAGACAARVVAGLLNGIICAWKCMIGESCDDLTQVRGFWAWLATPVDASQRVGQPAAPRLSGVGLGQFK
jgi:hypothetical protein